MKWNDLEWKLVRKIFIYALWNGDGMESSLENFHKCYREWKFEWNVKWKGNFLFMFCGMEKKVERKIERKWNGII